MRAPFCAEVVANGLPWILPTPDEATDLKG